MSTTRCTGKTKARKRCKNRVGGRRKRCAFHSGEKKTSICWPGYERVPGTKAYSKGSCRKVAAKKRRRNPIKRRKQRSRKLRRNPSCAYSHVVIKKSTRDGKKWMAVFTNKTGRSKTVHYGATGYQDYTQHRDKGRRSNYISRHRARENWNKCDTAGALSRWVLWGNSTSRKANEAAFRRKFRLKSGTA